MIYTNLTKKALKLAYEAHKNQVDHSGIPYVFHPYHLAEQMTDENTTITALLHDVIEDTDISLEQLSAYGFPEEVMVALHLLTKEEHQDYMEYVSHISKNKIATIVKLADLEHNSDMSRLDEIGEYEKKRYQKYQKAKKFLLHAKENF